MGSSAIHPELARLHRLQMHRASRPFDASISLAVQRVVGDAQRTQKRLCELAELWQQILPAEIVDKTALAGLRAGVLQVTADSAAVSFELDRLLRSGAELELRQHFRGTLVRIKVRVEPMPAQHELSRATGRGDGADGKKPATARKPSASSGQRRTRPQAKKSRFTPSRRLGGGRS